MPRTMEPEELEELKESFDYNDADNDGRIDLDEFVRMLEQLEAQMTSAEVRVGFRDIDTDDNGTISFDEFLNWWAGT